MCTMYYILGSKFSCILFKLQVQITICNLFRLESKCDAFGLIKLDIYTGAHVIIHRLNLFVKMLRI